MTGLARLLAERNNSKNCHPEPRMPLGRGCEGSKKVKKCAKMTKMLHPQGVQHDGGCKGLRCFGKPQHEGDARGFDGSKTRHAKDLTERSFLQKTK